MSFVYGYLGDDSGNVMLANNMCYVRIDDVVSEVYNDRVPPLYNLRVMIGSDPDSTNIQQVLGAYIPAEGVDYAVGVQQHWMNHLWMGENGGLDTAWIEDCQLLPGRVFTNGSLTVWIRHGIAFAVGKYLNIADTFLNMTGIVPTSGAVYALITLNSSGVIGVRTCDPVVPAEDLTIADIPSPNPNERALAAVRLEAGQTEILESLTRQDIIDLRYAKMPNVMEHDHDERYATIENLGTPGNVNVHWNNVTSKPVFDLNFLDDATITNPVAGQVLQYSAGEWKNLALPLNDLSDVTIDTPQTGDVMSYDGEKWVNTPNAPPPTNLDDLADVDVPTPSDQQVLGWKSADGKWKAQTVLAFSGLAKITVGITQPTNPSVGDLWIDTN